VCNKCPAIIRYGYCTKCLKIKKQMLKKTQNLQEEMELKKKNDMKLEYMQILQEDMELKKKTNIFAHKATLYNFSELELIESITTEYANSPSSFDTILLN
jgi:hypothetical protein